MDKGKLRIKCKNCGQEFEPTCHITRQKFCSDECWFAYNNAKRHYTGVHVYLTQDDIRQVQLAKGAIYAGISLMAKQLGLEIRDIQKVQLAGAFGSFLNPQSACRIDLLPAELLDRIAVAGNAAGSGAKMLAGDRKLLPLTQTLTEKIEFLELASLPEFSRTFAKSMNFREESQ